MTPRNSVANSFGISPLGLFLEPTGRPLTLRTSLL